MKVRPLQTLGTLGHPLRRRPLRGCPFRRLASLAQGPAGPLGPPYAPWARCEMVGVKDHERLL